MTRDEKRAEVEKLREVFRGSAALIAARYQGMTVADSFELRAACAKSESKFKVVKNRLAKIALAETDAAPLADLFVGPTAISWSSDPIAIAKTLADYAKANEKFIIVGGMVDGASLDAKQIQALAELPSIEEIRARLVGLLVAPATKIASIALRPGEQIARVLAARAREDA